MDITRIWSPVAEAWREILQSGWLQITQYDASHAMVQVIGVSQFTPPELNRLLLVTQTLVSTVDPFHRTHSPTANPKMDQLYLRGEPTKAPLKEFLSNILSPELCDSLASYPALQDICAVPLWYQGQVAGAIIAYGVPAANQPLLTVLATLGSLLWCSEMDAHATRRDLEALQSASRRWLATGAQHRYQYGDMVASQIQTRLLALMWRLDDILESLSSTSTLGDTLLDIRERLSGIAQDDLEQLSHNMYPPILRLGLAPALNSLINQSHSAHQITIFIDDTVILWDYPTHNQISLGVRLGLYTIAQTHLQALDTLQSPRRVQVKLAVAREALWLHILVSPPSKDQMPQSRDLIDQHVRLLTGQAIWSHDGWSLIAIIPMTTVALDRAETT